jgi:L-ascorbate metabolism protein UlaG (beta-lactamase superfamily)
MSDAPTLRLVGGPTALITYGGLRILTDPAFDPPGDHPRPGTDIVLHKVAGPALTVDEVLPIDVVLLSHDHHADNLDPAGRSMLSQAGRVLTTVAGAERLDGNATGLEPGASVDLDGRGSGPVTISAVPALHGPPEVAAKNGPVIGFILRCAGQPTVYVSGDNASVETVEEIVVEHAPIDAVVLFAGGAQVPAAWGDAFLTLTAQTAVEAAHALDPAPIVPIHQDGWAHFTSGAEDLRTAFEAAGLSHRLRMVAPGGEVTLSPEV